MADSVPIVLATGAIVAANELLFAPLEGSKAAFNWRLIPATAGLALALAGLEHLSRPFAVGLAWLGLFAALTVPFGNAPTPLDNASKVLGLAQKVT